MNDLIFIRNYLFTIVSFVYLQLEMIRSAHDDRFGGYKYKFIDVLEDYYPCGSCWRVMRDAVQTQCGHLFCESCIYFCFRNTQYCNCPVCKQCIDRVNLISHEAIRSRIQSLIVECPYRTCQERCTITEMELHVENCEYKNFVYSKFMTVELQHTDIDIKPDHRCIDCDQLVVFANLSYHQTTVCPQLIINCPHKCGLRLKRKELAEHEGLHDHSCTTMLRKCPYEKCSFDGRLHELQDHLRGSTLLHAGLYQEDVTNLKEELVQLRKDNQKITKDIDKLTKQHMGLAQSSYGSKLKLSAFIRSHVPPYTGEDWNLFQESVTIPTCGKLIWSIPDFKETFKKTSEHTKIYSQPFYSNPTGFKLCCYLQMGVDQVMRLSFQMMQGKFDEILTKVSNFASVVLLHKKQSSSMRFQTDVQCDTDRSTEVVGSIELLSFQQILHFIDSGSSLFMQIEVT